MKTPHPQKSLNSMMISAVLASPVPPFHLGLGFGQSMTVWGISLVAIVLW